jgi:DNA end-binding protein Ku
MAQSIWTGSIGFGLVQIPVSLHAAEEQHELDMTLLDKTDLSPVGYKRFNKATNQEVDWADIVKGYEHAKNEFGVLTPADFQAANVKATKHVDILAFVDFTEIDPRYIEKPYYLSPHKTGVKAYALLRETLRATGKAGIGKIVIRTRQRLAAVMAQGDALVLMVLRFHDELRDTANLSLPETNLDELGVKEKEIQMARHLVEALAERFEPEKYTDEYRDDIMRLVERKVAAGEVNTLPDDTEKTTRTPRQKTIDLAALLTQSVQGLNAALPTTTPANENSRVKKAQPRSQKAGHKAKTPRSARKSAAASGHKKSA